MDSCHLNILSLPQDDSSQMLTFSAKQNING